MVDGLHDDEIDIDGTFFKFPEDWLVAQFDTWPQYAKATGELSLEGCDVVALDEETLWLIEMKDYTYPGAKAPGDLTKRVGRKAAGTLALLYALQREASDSFARDFAKSSAATTRIYLALHVEVKDGGRGAAQVQTALKPYLDKLRRAQKALGLHKAHVTSSLAPSANTPWTARRDPSKRGDHKDR